MSSSAISRLGEERRNWRKDPLPDFYARPVRKADNSTDLMNWECGIPGKAKTPWEGGLFKLILRFTDEYPSVPPSCVFKPVLFHPNVFDDGSVCLSIIGDDWVPSITVRQILLGIQSLLNEPNPKSPANGDAEYLMRRNPAAYEKKIREQTARNIPSDA
jgi:ubiquitin-conjugating enzyme E2 I